MIVGRKRLSCERGFKIALMIMIFAALGMGCAAAPKKFDKNILQRYERALKN